MAARLVIAKSDSFGVNCLDEASISGIEATRLRQQDRLNLTWIEASDALNRVATVRLRSNFTASDAENG